MSPTDPKSAPHLHAAVQALHEHGSRARGVDSLLTAFLLHLVDRPTAPEREEMWGVIALVSAHCEEAANLERKLLEAWEQDCPRPVRQRF